MKYLISGLLSIILFASSIALFWLGSTQVYYGFTSNNWPSTTGVIEYSEFEYAGSGSNGQRRPVVRYRYQIDNQHYQSDQIAFGPVPLDNGGEAVLSMDRDAQIKSFATIDEGTNVTVYYHPSTPSNAVLLPGAGLFVLIYIFCGILTAAMSWLCLLIATGRIKT